MVFKNNSKSLFVCVQSFFKSLHYYLVNKFERKNRKTFTLFLLINNYFFWLSFFSIFLKRNSG